MHSPHRPALGLLTAGTLLLASAVPALAGDPAGNNGTVKVSDVEFDAIPDNSPHQGCTFYVQFYGYDQDQAEAVAVFTVLLPEGGETAPVLTETNISIGGDPASGAGTASGFDAARWIDANDELVGYVGASNPNQGVHVRLTVTAPGSNGNDTKSKVFWAKGCQTGSEN
jgi:hypothetical protein